MNDIITYGKIAKRLPKILWNLPGLIKGSAMAKTTDPTKPLGLGLAFEKATAQNPQGLALICGQRQLSYQDLNAWANRIAHFLLAQGFKKGDVIALNMENRPEMMAAIIACAKLGICGALINTSQRGQVLAHSLNLVNIKGCIVGQEQWPAMAQLLANKEACLQHIPLYYFADQDTLIDVGHAPEPCVNLASAIEHLNEDNPTNSQQIFLNDALFNIYTSGTTGLPKAVKFNHGRWWRAYGGFGFSTVKLKAHDRIYCALPFYHGAAMVISWSSAIAGNACLVMERKFSASRFWQHIREHNCTAFGYIGEFCRYLLEQPPSPLDKQNKVRVMVGNGLRPSLWHEFKQRFDIDHIAELYASSEGNVGFTNVFNFDRTVGFAPTPYAIVQYDKEQDQIVRCPKGKIQKVKTGGTGLLLGEITPKSPFDGYTQSDKNHSSILRDVFKAGDAWFNTGDLMKDLGFRHAQFVDRLGDTFRWKGENVSTCEVETILEQFPQIIEAVAYGVEIPNTNGRAGMAQLRIQGSLKDFDFDGLLKHLQQGLPSYAVPIFLRIKDGDMQITGTFKHQKYQLKEQAYDVEKTGEPVWVNLPKQTHYAPLDCALRDQINNGAFRF